MKSSDILKILGYNIHNDGKITESTSQLAVISLEPTPEGGILRIHESNDGSLMDENFDALAFPIKTTQNYVYFQNAKAEVKVKDDEFTKNALLALDFYRKVKQKGFGN